MSVRRGLRHGGGASLFWLGCLLSAAAHIGVAAFLVFGRTQTPGVAAPQSEAISVNIETTDILNSPEETEQAPDSVAADYIPQQEEIKPPEEKPEDAAPPPEPEQTAKADEAPEDTDRKRIEEEERQRLAEEQAARAAEQAEKERLAEEALRKAEEAERQRIAEAARRRAEDEERERAEEAERQREALYRLAEEQRRRERDAARREEERRKREEAEHIAQQEARKRREREQGQNAAEASRGRQASRGRVSASRGSMLSYGSTIRARVARNTPRHGGSGGRSTVVAFTVSATGALISARVVRTSGNAVLDQTALAALRRSSPFPRPPQGAAPAQLSFTLPFNFR